MKRIRLRVWILIAVILLVLTLPVLLADLLAGKGFIFNGFLYNPLDGNSYLAKMVEGARGDWKFTLPYTAEPGEGAYIFLFYLVLGKLATLLGIPLITAFHILRIGCSLFLLIELWFFCKSVFPENEDLSWKAYRATMLFSGMGWLGLAFSRLTPDLTVPEAYVFLSSYANPHFPLSLALVLLALRLVVLQQKVKWQFWLLLVGFILANLSPFSVVVALLVMGACALWDWIARKKLEIRNAFLFGISALPVLIYQLYAIKADPVLAAWDAQNVTPAPLWIDLLIAFLPGVLLAVGAIFLVIRDKKVSSNTRMLMLWMGLGFILTYLPFNLQRRFLVGLSIPVAMLAVLFIENLKKDRVKKLLVFALYSLTLPSILLILLLGLISVSRHDPKLVVSQSEAQALHWIIENTPPDAVILSSAEIGNFIPAQTGRRVIYGHPFETINVLARQTEVKAFFDGTLDGSSATEYICQNNITYIFYGPREAALGSPDYLDQYKVAYSTTDVKILEISAQP